MDRIIWGKALDISDILFYATLEQNILMEMTIAEAILHTHKTPVTCETYDQSSLTNTPFNEINIKLILTFFLFFFPTEIPGPLATFP